MSLHPLKFKNLIALAALGAALACGGKDSPGPDRHDHNHLLRLVVHPSVIRKGQAAHLHAEFDRGEGEVTPGVGPVQCGANVLVSPERTTTYTLRVKTPHHGVRERSVTLRVE